jgi:hypothetical protein
MMKRLAGASGPALPTRGSGHAYSEAQFKTLKYRPGFPQRFDSIEHARAFCRDFFAWYNNEHRHSGIGLMTPATVDYGHAEALHADRARVLDAAYTATPERFVRQSARTARAAHPSVDQQAHRHREGRSLKHARPTVSFDLTGSGGCASVAAPGRAEAEV